MLKELKCNANGKEIVATCEGKRIRIFCKNCNRTVRYDKMPEEQELFIDVSKPKDVVKSEYKFPFGKYKGKYLHDIPVDYLIWFINGSGAKDTKEAVKVFIKFSDNFNKKD